jgi:hypothetical protein
MPSNDFAHYLEVVVVVVLAAAGHFDLLLLWLVDKKETV